MRAIRNAFDLNIDDVSLAVLCRRAEVEFVGARVGIMDQMASSVGQMGNALFLDTLDLGWRLIPIPEQLELIVIHSGISHSHASGNYNQRWTECQEACRVLSVTSLRELSLADLPGVRGKLLSTLWKRVRHVVTENARVLATLQALEQSDFQTLGVLFRESHVSMRDDYEVSLPEIDVLVDLANRNPQVYGARLTGGGFGGSVVVAAKAGSAPELADLLVTQYKELTGRKGVALVT
jgi:galactokinase